MTISTAGPGTIPSSRGNGGRADLVGGSGADTFAFTNRTGPYGGPDDPVVGGRMTIADFDKAAGDRIQISVSEYEFEGTAKYVGEVASLDDLGSFELGYVRAADGFGGESTVVRFANVAYADDDYLVRCNRT